MEEKRDTVGKISLELLQKTPDTQDPILLEREMQQDYLDELIACVEENESKFEDDFYVVVLTKNEKLMPNVFRNYFLARSTCPTPNYEQSVFKYNREDENVTHIWTVPCRETCKNLKENALQVVPEERQLLSFVLDFASGDLFKRAKVLNGEMQDSPLIM